jgi:riboflavin synthase
MFTGIVERRVSVIAAEATPAGRRVSVAADWADVRHGESVAVDGVCLTVAGQSCGRLDFDVIGETLAKTTLGGLRAGDVVHVERSLRVGDRLDGHVVQGHVDGTVRVVAVKDDPADWRLTLEAPSDLARFVVPKGSVTLDGVSLTVAAVGGLRFDVALIPTTLQITKLGSRRVGDRLNLECDVLTKTIVATMERLEAMKR